MTELLQFENNCQVVKQATGVCGGVFFRQRISKKTLAEWSTYVDC